VPNQATTEALVSIEAIGSIPTDESDAPFTITAATNYYVDANIGSNESYNGLTSEVSGSNGPWKAITYASTQTASGDTIHVATGTYNAATGESFPISILAGVHILGTTLATIDAGSTAQDVITMANSSTIEGFTINSSYNGVKYCINVSGSNVQIKDNKFNRSGDEYTLYVNGASSLVSGNTISSSGGGNRCVNFYTSSDGFTLLNNTIEANTSSDAVYSYQSNNGTIIGNHVTYNGSTRALYLRDGSNYSVRDNLVIGPGTNATGIYFQNVSGAVTTNEVRSFATGIYANSRGTTGDDDLDINQNTIVKNSTGVRGAGDTVNVINSIIANDPADGGGTGGAAGSIGLYRTGGTLNSSYNDIYGCETIYSGTINNKTGDKSKNAKFADSGSDDYHLDYNSPCIDAGDPTSEVDPDGSRADQGAYYFDQSISGTIAVYVIQPDGGESLVGLSTYEIQWYATKEGVPLDHIEISYSTNEGFTYTNIATDEANDGSYIWTVAEIITTEALIRISAIGSAATDESDAVFSITGTVLSVSLYEIDGLTDYTTWEIGTAKDMDTVYLMVTAEAVLVSNEGNVAEDFSISGEATSWTLSSTGETGTDICILMGLFNSTTVPTAEAFALATDIITGEAVWATESAGSGYFEGEEAGANVAVGSNRRLYIYLKTPIEITGGDEERFTLTIGVKAH